MRNTIYNANASFLPFAKRTDSWSRLAFGNRFRDCE
jgi:hypothetical protein